MRIFIEEDIQGSKLKDFLEFIKKISNTYSIARDFDGKLPEDIMQRMNQELKDHIIQDDVERREKYRKNADYRKNLYNCLGISKHDEVMVYFNNILAQEMELADLVLMSGEDQMLESKRDDLIQVQYTRQSLVTRGGPFELCYFTYGPTLSEILMQMNSLFAYYSIESYLFMDLAFYHGKEVKLAICSHEGHASLNLKEEEYQEFLALHIPHHKG